VPKQKPKAKDAVSPGACVLRPCASGPVPRVACHSEGESECEAESEPNPNPNPSSATRHQHPEAGCVPVVIGASRRVDALADD